VGLGLAAPICGAALPFQGVDPFPIPGCSGPPIRAVIRVRLAALPIPILPLIPDREAW